LAQRSRLWTLVRSLSHPSNSHSHGHAMMLTGRTALPPGFDPNRPTPVDWPSIAAVAGQVTPRRGLLPPAVVLPEKLIHMSGHLTPGQSAGQRGSGRAPWFIEASPYRPRIYGAYPRYAFTMQPEAPGARDDSRFEAPSLALPPGVSAGQLGGRLGLLGAVERQAPAGQTPPALRRLQRTRALALALLPDPPERPAVH